MHYSLRYHGEEERGLCMRAEPGAPPGPLVIPSGVRQHPWGHLCAAAGWATAAVTRRG